MGTHTHSTQIFYHEKESPKPRDMCISLLRTSTAIPSSDFIEKLFVLKIETPDDGTIFVELEAKIRMTLVKHRFHDPDLVNTSQIRKRGIPLLDSRRACLPG